MKRSMLIGLTLVTLAALGLVAYVWWPRPATRVAGDAWDYRLLPEDMPAGWTFAGHAVQTAYDLAAEQPITPTAVLNNVQQIYSARYAPPENSEYADFTMEVLLYDSSADAEAALNAEDLGENWERVESATLGEQSQVWHYRNPEFALNQNLYRVDFRYLNALGSVTMFGTAEALPDADEPLGFARQILAKMQAEPTPPALERLQARRLPDLRSRLLTLEQVDQLDTYPGGRWQIHGDYLGSWTENRDFSPEAQPVLNQLGRIAGYQMYFVKPLTKEEEAQDAGSFLFQQISVYERAESAPAGLQSMIGLQGVEEMSVPPRIGERTRIWYTLFARRNLQDIIAITEISFSQGPYVATVQLQSVPLALDADREQKLNDNLQLAIALAQALAENLKQ